MFKKIFSQLLNKFVLISYQSGIDDMVHGREPLPDPEADPPERDDVGQEGVPHDVATHHPAAFVLAVKKPGDVDGQRVRPGQNQILKPYVYELRN